MFCKTTLGPCKYDLICTKRVKKTKYIISGESVVITSNIVASTRDKANTSHGHCDISHITPSIFRQRFWGLGIVSKLKLETRNTRFMCLTLWYNL